MLCDIDCSKATGPDGISEQTLKQTASSIACSLCHFKSIFLARLLLTIPAEWKTSNVVPTHKSLVTWLRITGLFLVMHCEQELCWRGMYAK